MVGGDVEDEDAPTVPDVTGWITTVLDLGGAVLVTVALALGLWPVIGAFALAVAGGFVWLFSAFVMWRAGAPGVRMQKRVQAVIVWARARRAARARRTATPAIVGS